MNLPFAAVALYFYEVHPHPDAYFARNRLLRVEGCGCAECFTVLQQNDSQLRGVQLRCMHTLLY